MKLNFAGGWIGFAIFTRVRITADPHITLKVVSEALRGRPVEEVSQGSKERGNADFYDDYDRL